MKWKSEDRAVLCSNGKRCSTAGKERKKMSSENGTLFSSTASLLQRFLFASSLSSVVDLPFSSPGGPDKGTKRCDAKVNSDQHNDSMAINYG